MSLIKGKVIEVIEINDEFIRVKAEYIGGHKMFAPLGFEYEFRDRISEEIKEGFIWAFINYPNSEIISYPSGHCESMKGFEDKLKNLLKK